MVPGGLVDDEQGTDGLGLRDVGVGGDPVLLDPGGAAAGVVHEEAAVRRVVRVEGEPEQPSLPAAFHPVGDVEERGRRQGAIPDDPDATVLLHHEEAVIPRRRREVHGRVEAARDGFEGDGRVARRHRRARAGAASDEEQDPDEQTVHRHLPAVRVGRRPRPFRPQGRGRSGGRPAPPGGGGAAARSGDFRP